LGVLIYERRAAKKEQAGERSEKTESVGSEEGAREGWPGLKLNI